ncbi:sugar phosphate isomerase/epimerase family protein [Paenibacillus silvisoli]|uniref:sugar phosphate isomerase/epimerase family protein n=1 Tax=Paenibacillus silvisoli TaxID=3110539 RepID=UPI0028056032|nr:sugar phosphate isomerase/epimerase [Paenibacillus silvisoli]
MKLGIFTNSIKAASVEELAERIAGFNLHYAVLDTYPGLTIDLDDPSAKDCKRIKQAFEQAGVKIAAVGGYSNLLHPVPERRKQVHRRFTGLMRLCEAIDSPMLCSETGTYHPGSDWDWDPANGTEQAMEELVRAVRPLVDAAEGYGIKLGFEPYVMNVCHSAERAAQLVQALGSNYVQLVADPAGLLTKATLAHQETVLAHALQQLTPYLGLVHCEDCSPDPEGHFLWQAAGTGHVAYPIYMNWIAQSGYEGPFILEHVAEDELPAAREFVRREWESVQPLSPRKEEAH